MSLLYSHLKLFHSDITVQKQNIVQYLVLTLFSVSESQIKLQKNLSGSDGKQEYYTFSTKLGDFSTTTTPVDVRGGHIESQNRSKKKKNFSEGIPVYFFHTWKLEFLISKYKQNTAKNSCYRLLILWEGFPVEVCATGKLKKPPTEGTLYLQDSKAIKIIIKNSASFMLWSSRLSAVPPNFPEAVYGTQSCSNQVIYDPC